MISTENIGLFTQGGGVEDTVSATGNAGIDPQPGRTVNEEVKMVEDKGCTRFCVSEPLPWPSDDEHPGDIFTSGTIDGGDVLVNAAAPSANGKAVSASVEDYTVHAWNTKTTSFAAHGDDITRLRCSLDRRRVIFPSDDSAVRLWDMYGASPVTV